MLVGWLVVKAVIVASLIQDVAEVIRGLRTLDGVPVTEEQDDERARTVVQRIVLKYGVTELPL